MSQTEAEAISDPVSVGRCRLHRQHGSWNRGRRWAVTVAVLVAMVTYYVYVPIPPGVTEPWKARQVMALLRTIGHVSYFSEKIGLANRFNTTRFIVDSLSLIPPKNYAGLQVVDTTFDGVGVRVYMPDHRQVHGPAVIFYHGGGWFMGSVETHDHITTALAQKLQAVIVSVEYRLCPENPYPAPLEDCLRATRYFMDNSLKYGVDSARIAIIGDSAGGNLAASATLLLQNETKLHTKGMTSHRPRLQVLIYPLLQGADFRLPSYLQNDGVVLGTRHELANVVLLYIGQTEKHALDMLAHRHVTKELRREMDLKVNASKLPARFLAGFKPRLAAGGGVVTSAADPDLVAKVGAALRDPFCMPLMALDEQLASLPETLVITSEYDVLRDEGALYARRLKDAGVSVTWRNYRHSYHGMLAFFNEPLKTEEGARMMEELVAYLKARL